MCKRDNARILTNFSAGPGALPSTVIEKFAQQIGHDSDLGYSFLECSHREAVYKKIHADTMQKIRATLQVPHSHSILLLGGGATLQFAMLAYNFASSERGGAYLLSGAWATKAYQSAQAISQPHIVYDGAHHSYHALPRWEEIEHTRDAAYLHITSNETIDGTQFHDFPHPPPMPLIADMSSDIMTRAIPVENFAMIYAGAQKNIGISGLTVVIIENEFLQHANRALPPYLSYQVHARAHSIYNTPPVAAVFATQLVMDWIAEQGGVSEIAKRNHKKAALLYAFLDEHSRYYKSEVAVNSRSNINVVFSLPNETLTKQFIAAAAAQQIIGIAGHRTVGGCRVSLYNAISIAGVTMLIDFMYSFMKNNTK